MQSYFELNYASLVNEVLLDGETRKTRNATTRSLFAKTLTINMHGANIMPIITGRKSWYKGVLGEFAALVRQPKSLADFEKWGCNYWKKWADAEGNLNVDYGNAWFKDGQIEHLKNCLANNRTDRRMLINGWVPSNLANLSLPCCHYSYQFYVRESGHLDMLWNQRSADLMIGVPADILLGYTWLITLANEFGLKVGRLTMVFGDVHIYDSHGKNATLYCERVLNTDYKLGMRKPTYELTSPVGTPFEAFEPAHLKISDYDTLGPLEFELYE